MTEHTPGPWSLQPGDTRVVQAHLASGYTQEVAICPIDLALKENSETANARLIAAAPELLAALELATATLIRLTSINPNKRNSIIGTLDVIRAAIAKAKGGAS